MNKVLITGLTGFIGKHLYKFLIDNDIEIVAIAKNPDLSLKNVTWIIGDLSSDVDIIISKLSHHIDTFDCLYHIAWSGVQAKDKNNYAIQAKNIDIAKNIVEICHYVGCTKFINSGTVAEYVHEDGLINDKCVPSPSDLYGVMKVTSKNLIGVMANSYQINVINTIICSTYGEYRSDDNVISYTIKSLLNNESPKYGALNQMWDFLYVEDVAHALYLIGQYGLCGKTYGIGGGRFKRLKEYILDIQKIINPNIPIQIGALEEKYKQVLNSCVDSYLLQKDTGFFPEFSFEEGICRTINYYKNN